MKIESEKNDTYTTDGVKFRISSNPKIIPALGRALWNFLYLEEEVVAILFETESLSIVGMLFPMPLHTL